MLGLDYMIDVFKYVFWEQIDNNKITSRKVKSLRNYDNLNKVVFCFFKSNYSLVIVYSSSDHISQSERFFSFGLDAHFYKVYCSFYRKKNSSSLVIHFFYGTTNPSKVNRKNQKAQKTISPSVNRPRETMLTKKGPIKFVWF